MTFDEARAVVDAITIGWPLKAFDVRVRLEPRTNALRDWADGYALRIAWRAPHRDTGQVGEPLVLDTMLDELELRHSDAARLRSRVHDLLRMALMHELAESFLVNGVRVMDPHATPDERLALAHEAEERERIGRGYMTEREATRELMRVALHGEAMKRGDVRTAEVLDAMGAKCGGKTFRCADATCAKPFGHIVFAVPTR